MASLCFLVCTLDIFKLPVGFASQSLSDRVPCAPNRQAVLLNCFHKGL